jgi:hypothetical protein
MASNTTPTNPVFLQQGSTPMNSAPTAILLAPTTQQAVSFPGVSFMNGAQVWQRRRVSTPLQEETRVPPVIQQEDPPTQGLPTSTPQQQTARTTTINHHQEENIGCSTIIKNNSPVVLQCGPITQQKTRGGSSGVPPPVVPLLVDPAQMLRYRQSRSVSTPLLRQNTTPHHVPPPVVQQDPPTQGLPTAQQQTSMITSNTTMTHQEQRSTLTNASCSSNNSIQQRFDISGDSFLTFPQESRKICWWTTKTRKGLRKEWPVVCVGPTWDMCDMVFPVVKPTSAEMEIISECETKPGEKYPRVKEQHLIVYIPGKNKNTFVLAKGKDLRIFEGNEKVTEEMCDDLRAGVEWANKNIMLEESSSTSKRAKIGHLTSSSSSSSLSSEVSSSSSSSSSSLSSETSSSSSSSSLSSSPPSQKKAKTSPSWTPDEDIKLRDHYITKTGNGKREMRTLTLWRDFQKNGDYVNSTTSRDTSVWCHTCQERWDELCNGEVEFLAPWNDQEDIQLMILFISFYSQRDKWNLISQKILLRSEEQCMNRWQELLSKIEVHNWWSQRENEALLRCMLEHGAVAACFQRYTSTLSFPQT